MPDSLAGNPETLSSRTDRAELGAVRAGDAADAGTRGENSLARLNQGLLDALLHAQFCWLWLAKLLSQLGSQAGRTALILLLARSDGAAASVGLLIWCEILPGTAAAFLASGLVDRVSRRRLLIVADLARSLVLAGVALYPEKVLLFAATAVNSVATAFFNPARSAVLAQVVSKDLLPKANGLDQIASTFVLIAGPFLGAQMLFAFGVRSALLLDATTFVVSAIAITAAAIPVTARALSHAEPLWREIVGGWCYARDDRLARVMLILSAAAVLAVGMWIPVASSFIRSYLHAGEELLAFQLMIVGAGGMFGAPAAVALCRKVGRGKLVACMFLAEGLSMVAYSRISDVFASNALMFLWGMAVSGITVPFLSLLQDTVPDSHLGRVFAINEQTENLGSAFAIVVPVVLGATVAPENIFAVAGLLYLMAVAVALRTRSGRQLLRTV